MAERSFPFNSIAGDRRYKAERFREYFALFIGDGIFYKNANALKVKQDEGMTVILNAGAAWVAGGGYINDGEKRFILDTADGVMARIDRVVIRCDYALRDIYATVKKGAYSAQPAAPALQRDADAYELGIADIYIGKGVISVTQANITDLRLNTSICGIVTGLIEQADTTEIFNQIETYFEEFKTEYAGKFTQWTREYIEELQAWTDEQERELAIWIEETQQSIDEWKEDTENSLDAWIRNTQKNMDEWVAGKEGDLAAWMQATQESFTAWMEERENSFETWETQNKDAFAEWMEEQETAFNSWMSVSKQAYEEWLANLKATLDENAAGHLQNEIEKLQDDTFMLKYSLGTKTVEFLQDGRIRTEDDTAVAETAFGYDQTGNETVTTTVVPNTGSYDYVMRTTFYENQVTSVAEKKEKNMEEETA